MPTFNRNENKIKLEEDGKGCTERNLNFISHFTKMERRRSSRLLDERKAGWKATHVTLRTVTSKNF